MNIDGIENGIVLDHIEAGKAMLVYKYLGLDKLGGQVALIQNCPSKKMGIKDIVKVSEVIDLDLDVLGYIDPQITVCYIQDGKIVKKTHADAPEVLTGVISCKNPRCITSIEQELPQVFYLADKDQGLYHYKYCDAQVKAAELKEEGF